MKKKILTIIIAVIMSLGIISASNAETEYFYDNADLTSYSEYSSINSRLEEISEKYGYTIIIGTVDTYMSTRIEDYAEKLFFDNFNGNDAFVLAISTYSRDWTMQAFGKCQDIFIDDGIRYIENIIVPMLSDTDYYEAFSEFARLTENHIEYYNKNGEAYGTPKFNILQSLIISAIIGLIIAIVILANMKSKLKTVKKQTSAGMYIKENSLLITNQRDFFLYRTMTRVPKAKTSSSSTSSGRGQGRSGKF